MTGWGESSTQFFTQFFKDESGQGTVEYVLILSAVLIAAIQINRQFIKALDAGLLRLGGQLERDLKSGRAPPHVWSN